MPESKRVALIRIVSEVSGVQQDKLKDDTRLFHDLGVHGDDAHELLEKIQKHFGTSFQGFEWTAYFPDETEGIGHKFAAWLNPAIRKRRLTLGHLISVVEAGRWSEPHEDIRE